MGKVYASSDWHGCAKVGLKVLDYLASDDMLFYLGDAMDRGPDSAILLEKLLNDGRICYLKGNHEALMEKALPLILDEENIGLYSFHKDVELWYMNGGRETVKSLKKHHITKAKMKSYISVFKQMPTSFLYSSPKGHDVILEHAGFSLGDYNRNHDPLWDREHFYDDWSEEEKNKKTYLIHGHTPVQYLQFMYGYKDQPPLTKEQMSLKHSWYDLPTDVQWKPEVIRYCNGHKFDIDMCTICSGRIALIDLDTFEVKYFDE